MGKLTVEILCGIHWLVKAATAPTLRNLFGDGNESFRRQLRRLAEDELIEKVQAKNGEWIYTLTELGRQKTLEGDDPELHWSRPWDGVWHLLLFDLENADPAVRKSLWRRLRSNGFGCLQRSVWVTNALVPELAQELRSASDDPKSLILLQTKEPQGASKTPQDFAASAWNFEASEIAYEEHLKLLHSSSPARSPGVIIKWLLNEREQWKKVLEKDPLLPRELYPKRFSGFEVNRKRHQILSKVKKKLKKQPG